MPLGNRTVDDQASQGTAGNEDPRGSDPGSSFHSANIAKAKKPSRQSVDGVSTTGGAVHNPGVRRHPRGGKLLVWGHGRQEAQ